MSSAGLLGGRQGAHWDQGQRHFEERLEQHLLVVICEASAIGFIRRVRGDGNGSCVHDGASLVEDASCRDRLLWLGLYMRQCALDRVPLVFEALHPD
jgi:hypothetical protein